MQLWINLDSTAPMQLSFRLQNGYAAITYLQQKQAHTQKLACLYREASSNPDYRVYPIIYGNPHSTRCKCYTEIRPSHGHIDVDHDDKHGSHEATHGR